MLEKATTERRGVIAKDSILNQDFDLLVRQERELLTRRVEVERTKTGRAREVMLKDLDDRRGLIRESRETIQRLRQ